jgi:L-serine deaminase
MLPALADALANVMTPHSGGGVPGRGSTAGSLHTKGRARALKNNNSLRAA